MIRLNVESHSFPFVPSFHMAFLRVQVARKVLIYKLETTKDFDDAQLNDYCELISREVERNRKQEGLEMLFYFFSGRSSAVGVYIDN